VAEDVQLQEQCAVTQLSNITLKLIFSHSEDKVLVQARFIPDYKSLMTIILKYYEFIILKIISLK